MKRIVLLGFLLLLAIDTAQQVTTKLASNRIGSFQAQSDWLFRVLAEPLVGMIVLCYVAAFLTYTWLLKHAPVGPLYAAAHGHIVTVLMISLAVLGERLSSMQAVGCLLIVAGIGVLAATEKM